MTHRTRCIAITLAALALASCGQNNAGSDFRNAPAHEGPSGGYAGTEADAGTPGAAGVSNEWPTTPGSGGTTTGGASGADTGAGGSGGDPISSIRIEAEDYDDGGANAAYFDTTPGNEGGAYRQDDVDIEEAAQGGFHVGWIAQGEWLQYTFTLASPATYDVRFSVASETAGGTFHLENQGTDVTGPISFAATGGWESWTTVVASDIALPAGATTLRLVADSSEFNVDWLELFSCTPDCSGKQCGDDGCGGTCGACPAGTTCDMLGQCVEQGGISPTLVGNNVWYFPVSDPHWAMAGEAGLQIVRIGGIEFDNNMPSVGELDDWVNHIKALGAEPMIQVSQYKSAADAAALVRHFNVETGNPVRFWNIGNEPWLERGKPDLATMAGVIAPYVKSHASAMKAEDPTIKIFAADMCDFFDGVYGELLGTGANSIAGKDGQGHNYIDGISWHRYVGGDLANAGAKDFEDRIVRTRALIDQANATHNRSGDEALGWGIGEFNADGGAAVHTFANGQMFGQVYGHAMKHGATYVASWSIFENGGNRTGTDFSFIDGPTGKPRASYYHMQMVARGFAGGTYRESASDLAGVRVFGATAPGKVVLMAINIDNDAHDLNVRFDGAGGNVRVSAGVDGSYAGAIGGKETQVLVFDTSAQLLSRTVYNQGHFDGNPPVVETFTP